MSHQRVLFWVVLMMAGIGLMDSGANATELVNLHLLAGLLVSYLCFIWYCSDSDARGYRRSRWLSAGVVACAFCAIPYYLLRSRPERERGGALMAYAAYLGVVAFAVWVGMAIHIGLAG
jgi:hypothetical protein